MALQPWLLFAVGGLSAALFAQATSTTQTTPPAPVTATTVRLLTDPLTCTQPTTLTLFLVKYSADTRSVIRSEVPVPNDSLDCRWTLEGLPSGEYEARLNVPTGSAGTQQFAVQGSAVEVIIPPAAVRVSGQVTVRGKPLAKADLRFWPPQDRGGIISATTDADGRYLVTLDRPDTYRVSLHATSAATQSKEMEFSAGLNMSDWSIAGGTVVVRLKWRRPDLPLAIYFDGPTRNMVNARVEASDETEITVAGLNFGTYRVSASQEGDFVTQATTVSIDANQPDASVALELVESRSSLILADVEGNPVRGANVRIRGTDSPIALGTSAEAEPGVYPLDGIRPGVYVSVRADGFVPMCRIMPLSEPIMATLERGRAIEVQFPTDATPAAMQIITLAGIPGSDCPIPMWDFRPQELVKRIGREPAVTRIEHFPDSYRFVMRRPGSVREIAVPDKGPVLVERDEKVPIP